VRARAREQWMAPEALRFRAYSEHSDVWSFGITLWVSSVLLSSSVPTRVTSQEMFSRGSEPYPEQSARQLLASLLSATPASTFAHNDRPAECPEDVYALMLECWHMKPHERPHFRALFVRVTDLIAVHDVGALNRVSDVLGALRC
jgi:serine/threonine protein kinase